MPVKAARTAWPLDSPRRTPPTSDLWEMAWELIFMATGKPICWAMSMASVGSRAIMVWATGIWNAASRALDSTSVSTLRPWARALSTIRRAPSTSGPLSSVRGSGVCIRRRWFS